MGCIDAKRESLREYFEVASKQSRANSIPKTEAHGHRGSLSSNISVLTNSIVKAFSSRGNKMDGDLYEQLISPDGGVSEVGEDLPYIFDDAWEGTGGLFVCFSHRS